MARSSDKIRRLQDKAARLHAAGKLVEALELYEQIVDAEPHEIAYRQKLAEVYRRLGRDADAIAAYAEVASRFARDGLLLRAIAVGKQILEIDPSHTETQRSLAELYARRRRPASSVATKTAKSQRRGPRTTKKLGDLVKSRPAIRSGGSTSDRSTADEALPSIPLFGDLPKNAFISLLSGLKMIRASEGDVIIHEGKHGDSFFILSRGQMRVEKATEAGRLTLAILHDGAFFGEMALLADAPRTASVVAEVDSELFELDRALLDSTVDKFPSVARVLRDFYRDRLLSTTMAVHPLFAPFSGTERRHLMHLFRSRPFAEGEALIEEGRPGDGLYLLLSGRLEVRVAKSTKPVAVLGPGDLCGEMSLLSNAPTMASVVAANDCLVLRLSRRRFLEVVEANPEVRELIEELVRDRAAENKVQVDAPGNFGTDTGEFLV